MYHSNGYVVTLDANLIGARYTVLRRHTQIIGLVMIKLGSFFSPNDFARSLAVSGDRQVAKTGD